MVNKFASQYLPFDKLGDDRVADCLEEYYKAGKLPECELLRAILKRRDINSIPNPYTLHAADIHRWVQNWFPARAWGSHRKVKHWIEEFK